MRIEFREDCCHFLEELVSRTRSAVAAGSSVGQGSNCFCPECLLGGDNYPVLYLIGKPLDGVLASGWVKGNDIELAKPVFHSIVREKQPVEKNAEKPRIPINEILSFCCSQPGFHSRRN